MTNDEILEKNEPGLMKRVGGSVTIGILSAMEEYAKKEAVAFILDVVGKLELPSNTTSYTEGSTFEQLLNLPSTVHKRYELYLKSKTNVQQ